MRNSELISIAKEVVSQASQGPWGVDIDNPNVVFDKDFEPIAVATNNKDAALMASSKELITRLTLILETLYDVARVRNDESYMKIIETTINRTGTDE